ncbi:MAG: dihydrofolate reductase family protein [Spirochaetaceae bacterium]
MKNIVYISSSLDGFIAKKDGGLDWLMNIPNPDNNDYGFSAFMESIDGLIMGRNTFEMVLSFGEWLYTKKVFVLSNTLKTIPEHLKDRAEIVNGELTQIVTKLNDRGFNNLYIDGGKTIQSFLKLDLIDEMIISQVPILLGSGIPLFSDLDKELNFKVVKTEKLNDFLVQSHYVRK